MSKNRTHWIREIPFRGLSLGFIILIVSQLASSQDLTDQYSVDLNTAKAVAIRYCLTTESRYAGSTEKDLVLSLAETGKTDNTLLYYVFNINTDDGFIIISADQNVTPVLCYVPDGSFSTDITEHAPAFNSWLETFSSNIEYARKYKTKNIRYQSLWDSYLSKGASDVDSMTLKLTATWDQSGNYNAYNPQTGVDGHPSGGYNGRTPSGCVAVATGQIIYYYKWPQAGSGTHSYTDMANCGDPETCNPEFFCGTDPSYGTLSFEDHDQTYNYGLMVNKPTEINYEISKLLYNISVSVNMDFAYCGAWAVTGNVADALPDYFGYSDAATYIDRKDYPDTWESVIIDQIRRERPIQYRGDDGTGTYGHSFVCFGYKTIDGATQFMFNWGWSGTDNGWYSLNDLTPDMTSYNFAYNARAVINIFPTQQPDLIITSASVSKSSIQSGDTLTLSFSVMNNGPIAAVATTAGCYLSTDNTLDKNDLFVAFVDIPSLTTLQSFNAKISDLNISSEGGDCYFLVEADPDHFVHESDEFNNVNYVQITITEAPASSGDYRSATSDNWNDPATWETYNGSDWVGATSAPDYNNSQITVLSGHNVTVAQNVSVDQVKIASGGIVTVASGYTLTINNGADAIDCNVHGTLKNSGTVVTDGSLAFNASSTYEHARNGGAIPVATWASASDCYITGITSTAPTITTGTQFGNFTWNCASQTSDISLSGKLNTIKGNFSLLSTNNTSDNDALILGNSEAGNLVIDGNFTQYGASTFAITGIQGGSVARSMTVKKDFYISGGEFNISGVASGTLNVAGNFSQPGGVITKYLSSSSVIFNGTGTQTYTSGGTVSNAINFTVNNGSYLQMAAENTTVSGIGTFNLASGATLGITSAEGIATSGATGNIQTSTRTFNAGATYIYNGTTNQSTGTGLPSSLTGKLTVDNTGNTVTLNYARTITGAGSLNLVTGTFAAGTNLSMSGGATINRSEGSMTGTPQGTGVYNVVYSGNSKTASNELSGTGLGNISVNLTAGQSLTLDQAREPDGNLTVTSGIFNLGSNTINRSVEGGTLTVANDAAMVIGGTNSMPSNYGTYSLGVTSTVEYNGGAQSIYPATYGNLTLSGAGTKTIQPGSAVTANGTLTTGNLLTIESTGLTSSGSLIVSGTGSSVGNVTYNRQMPASLYRYISSPVNSASLPPGQTYWIWDEPTGDWLSTTSYVAGRGYTMLAEDNKVSFTGTVVTSASIPGTAPYYSPGPPYTLDRSVWGGGGWNLLGNPFTSAMSGTSFISANTTKLDASYQALYVYDGTNYKYVAETAPGIPIGSSFGEYVQAGQGFFVLAKQNGVNFSFASGMQTHQTSVPMTKSAGVPWPGLQLKVQYGDKENSTVIVYNENMTAGLDPGYDIGLLSSGPEVEIYTALVLDNGVNFARQALPLGNYEENIIPVGIISEKGGQVTFSADVVPISHSNFYLEDRETGIITDLNKDSYTALLTPKISGTGRFFIYPSSRRMLSPARDNDQTLNLRIWASHNQVHIEGSVSENAVCTIYDLQGRKYTEVNLTDAAHNYITLPLSTKGIYVVKVTDGARISTQKVMIL